MILSAAPQAQAQTPEAPAPDAPTPAAAPEAPVAEPAEAVDPPAEAVPVDPDMEEAISRFRQGLTLARAGNCVGAIAELQVSLRLMERPNTLFNIARCQEELFRYDLAVAAYERYMAIAPSDAPDRGAVQGTMRQLRNLLGTITIRSNVPAQVWIGDRQVGESPGDVLVPGGRHAVEVRADGYLPTRREVEVASRATAVLEVELESAEVINNTNITNENITNVETTNVTEEGGAPVGVFIGAAVLTAASLATAAALSFRVLSLNSDGEALPAFDLEARDAQNERIANKAKVADVFWGVAGALAITTTVLIFLTDWGGDEHDDEGTTVTPVAGQGTLGLQVGGSF